MARYNLIMKDSVFAELMKKAQKEGMSLGRYLNVILEREVQRDIEIQIEDEGKKGRGLVWQCWNCGARVVVEDNVCWGCGLRVNINKIKEAVEKFEKGKKKS